MQATDDTRSAVPGDRLIGRYLPWLRAYLHRSVGPLIRSKESCSDLAQSICREVLRDRDRRFRDEAAFRACLRLEVRRKIIERHRYYTRLRRDARREVPRELTGEVPGPSGTPSEVAGVREHVARLERALDALSPDHREVILLAHVAGLSHREVAVRLRRSEAGCRNLLHRAMARLAVLMRVP